MNTNNPNHYLKNYINEYIQISNPQFAIMINGKWGCGKTYFIKKLIDEWNSKKKDSIENEDEILLKPIYVSLNGVNSINVINQKIKAVLNPLLYSKTSQAVKKIFFGLLKTAAHINLDADGDGKSDGKISFNIDSLGILKNENPKIKGNKIIIFDDLERCNLKIDEIFGYINEFVEHLNCKVILLCDEKKIYNKYSIDESKKEDTYKDFKEKLIGKTFILQTDIDSFVKQIDATNYIQENIALIISVFKASKIENLRLLKQSIIDFKRFANLLDEDILTHPNYNDYIKNQIAHFLITYLEYRSGNQDISKISNIPISDEEQTLEKSILSKYSDTRNEFEIIHRSKIISINKIIQFINDGYLDRTQLNKELKEVNYFRIRKNESWEELWNWQELDDDEFENIYKDVYNKFTNSYYDNPFVLIHIVSIFNSLSKKSIIKIDMTEIISIFKSQIDYVFKNYTKNISFNKVEDHSWSKGYSELKSDEFKIISEYVNTKIDTQCSNLKDEFLKGYFEEINDDSINQLYVKIDTLLPDRSGTYKYQPIFSNVNGKKLGNSIIKLRNENLWFFFSFLNSRYFPEKKYSNGVLDSFNAEDLDCFVGVKQVFDKKIDKQKPIKKYKLKIYTKLLDELIEKLKKFK